MKPGMKIFLSALTAIILIALIPIYDYFLKDRIDSTEVVVVKAGAEIKANETIKSDMLSIERRRKQDLVGDVVLAKDIKEVEGEDAALLLVGNSMISRKMIDYDDLIPDASKNEAIRPIVNDMIYAKPGSLRRKDKIDIYTISSSFAEKAEQESKSDNKVSSEDKKNIEKNLAFKEPLLTDIRVVYVKDSANNEVTAQDGKIVQRDERLSATGNISDLEVILNEEDFKKLMNSVVEESNKLYITYN